MTQALLPAIRHKRGRIINISSISGKIAGAFVGPYAASKFALEAFTDSLRREVNTHGVKVISINPGPISTPIWEKGAFAAKNRDALLSGADLEQTYGKQVNAFIERIRTAGQNADPVEKVVDVVLQSLEAARPKARYYVGKGIWFAAQLTKLPDNLLDRIV